MNWTKIKYFKPSEFKYPDQMSEKLIQILDEFREFVGKPICIHCDYRPNDRGQHGLGLAVDIHIKDMNVIDQYLRAEKFGRFKGIGVYTGWNNPGLHLDIREGSPARWGCRQVPIYIALDSEFLRRYYAELDCRDY